MILTHLHPLGQVVSPWYPSPLHCSHGPTARAAAGRSDSTAAIENFITVFVRGGKIPVSDRKKYQKK